MSSSAEPGARSARLTEDGRKLAAAACVVLLVSLFLPWYQKSVVPEGAKTFVTTNLSAFGSFTWIEAAILLVDAAVLTLLWLRRTGRRVELPAGDGTMITMAGGWIMLLLLVRVFDKPKVTGTAASVGLQWGLLLAMAAAGALLAAGLAMRAVERTGGHAVAGVGAARACLRASGMRRRRPLPRSLGGDGPHQALRRPSRSRVPGR